MLTFNKKSINKLFLGIILLSTLVFPVISFADTVNSGSGDGTQITYYYTLMEKQTFPSNQSAECSAALRGYLATDPITKNVDISNLSLGCQIDTNNQYIFYKLGTTSSQKYTDKNTCDKAALSARKDIYTSIIDAYNQATGKSLTFEKDFPFLYSCATSVPAQDGVATANTDANYYPLAQLPGLGEKCEPDSTGKTVCVKIAPNCDADGKNCTPSMGFAGYLNIMINIFIGICAVLAMIMIVMGGIQYMTSELVSSKQAAKESITNAILGLLLALGAYAILFTLDPNLVSLGIDNIPTVSIDSEENITETGSGTLINGVLVQMTKGSAAACSGGLVSVPADVAGSGGNTSGVICTEMLNKLRILKQKNPNFAITSTTTGNHQSQCHANINPPSEFPSTGNCADIGLRGGTWDDLCVAIVETGGLNFANEAIDTGKCAELKPKQTFKYSNGAHLHVNFTGKGTAADYGSGSGQTTEKLTSVTYSALKFTFTIDGFDSQKRYYYFVKGGTKDFNKSIINSSNILTGSLTATEYQYIKGKTITVEVRNPKGASIGKVTGITIP
jgi:hypothetical protein